MSVLEILIIVAAVSIVAGVIISTLIAKKKGKANCGDCSKCGKCCAYKASSECKPSEKLK